MDTKMKEKNEKEEYLWKLEIYSKPKILGTILKVNARGTSTNELKNKKYHDHA